MNLRILSDCVSFLPRATPGGSGTSVLLNTVLQVPEDPPTSVTLLPAVLVCTREYQNGEGGERGRKVAGKQGSILQDFPAFPWAWPTSLLPSPLSSSFFPAEPPPHLGKKTCQHPQDSGSQWSVKPLQLTHAPEWTGCAQWQVISPGHRVITVCRAPLLGAEQALLSHLVPSGKIPGVKFQGPSP